MKTFSIRESFGFGWELVKRNLEIVVFSTLAYSIFNISLRIDDFNIDPLPLFLMIAFAAAGIVVQIGYVKMTLRLHDGDSFRLKELFSYWRLFWRYLGTHFLYTAIIAGAMIVCAIIASAGTLVTMFPLIVFAENFVTVPLIIAVAFMWVAVGFVPVFLLALRYSFAFLLVVDKGLMPLPAMRRSKEITKGHKSQLLLFWAVAVAFNLVGLAFVFVGLLLTVPATMIAYAHAYRKLLGGHEKHSELEAAG